jgi:hypothetical protein
MLLRSYRFLCQTPSCRFPAKSSRLIYIIPSLTGYLYQYLPYCTSLLSPSPPPSLSLSSTENAGTSTLRGNTTGIYPPVMRPRSVPGGTSSHKTMEHLQARGHRICILGPIGPPIAGLLPPRRGVTILLLAFRVQSGIQKGC